MRKIWLFLKFAVYLLAVGLFSCTGKTEDTTGEIVIENAEMRLILGVDGQATSLVHKASGQECLYPGTKAPAFSITQYRPYNNELQLKYPANARTFGTDSVYREGDRLIVSFENINIVATIGLKITDNYIAFTLLIDENGEYELKPYEQLQEVTGGDRGIRAFFFNRNGKIYVAYWHTSEEDKIVLGLDGGNTHLFRELGQEISITKTGNGIVVPVGDRLYLETELSREKVISAFRDAKIFELELGVNDINE